MTAVSDPGERPESVAKVCDQGSVAEVSLQRRCPPEIFLSQLSPRRHRTSVVLGERRSSSLVKEGSRVKPGVPSHVREGRFEYTM